MKLIVCNDYEKMSKEAANVIAGIIKKKPDCVLGLATGSTPEGLYAELAKMCDSGEISFKDVKTVNLDEYCGLSPENDQSYRYFMNKNLFSKVDIKPENTFLPDGLAKDPDAETKRYDKVIKSMGAVDLQLLGIGLDGHIGFNEPADSFSLGTVKVKLDESTIAANARFFESANDVPRYAFTMGIGTILNAKTVLLMANGEKKAKIMKEALLGPVTPKVPASALQFISDRLVVIVDKEAGALLG